MLVSHWSSCWFYLPNAFLIFSFCFLTTVIAFPKTFKTRKALICLNHQSFLTSFSLPPPKSTSISEENRPTTFQVLEKKYKWCCINHLKKPKHLALLTLRSRAPKTILTALQTYYKRYFFNNLHVIYFKGWSEKIREKKTDSNASDLFSFLKLP